MGLFKKIMNQTRKPQGFLGGMMLDGINNGHAKVADWGLAHLTTIAPEKMVDGMKCHTVNEIESALSVAGFSKIKTDRHESKPWITVIAKK